jgi:hypothetical protein
MKIKFRYLLLLPVLSFAFNETDFPNVYMNENNFSNQKYYVDRYQLNINNLSTKKVYEKYRRYKSIMNNTYDIQLLLKPLIKPLMNIETIYGHPNFISTIVFPKGYKIISAQTTYPFKVFSFSNNLLTLSPKKDSDITIGNIVITAYDSNTGQNKIFNFIFKPYSLTSLKYDTKYGTYATPYGEFFSFYIKFVDNININPVKVIEKYISVFGKRHFNYVFRKNGYYDAILINNIPVYITRDDVQGDIEYEGKKFRISFGVKQ